MTIFGIGYKNGGAIDRHLVNTTISVLSVKKMHLSHETCIIQFMIRVQSGGLLDEYSFIPAMFIGSVGP